MAQERTVRNGELGKPLLEVKGLKTYFYTEDGVVKAVNGVDLVLHERETLGLVGETGCGKSVTSLSIMRLIGQPGRILEGEVLFQGRDLLQLPDGEMVTIRGNRISMIFQQPTSCLNPVFTIGDQVAEVLDIHRYLGAEAGRARATQLLRLVGIPDVEQRYDSYPHEISGGMAQRVMIAMALACVPDVLIADEPTTALDVTIQAQILDLMRGLREKMGTSIILITHDLGVIAEMCDNVAVMYAGRIVENAGIRMIFRAPKHPYTQGLLGAIPVLGRVTEELAVIPGSVPNLINLPPGCTFSPRCPERMPICEREEPPIVDVGQGHEVRCWLYDPQAAADAVGRAGPSAGATRQAEGPGGEDYQG